MLHAIWSPRAEAELEDVVLYIRNRDGRPETARRIAQQIREEVDSRASGVYQGQLHSHAPEEWRYVVILRWLVFYQPHPEGIEVMRVIDGSRDLPRQFE